MSVNIADTLTGPLKLTFKWTPVTFDCTSIRYIITFDCGYCPNTTARAEVVCTDITAIGSECTITIQTVVCGTLTGNITVVTFKLKGISLYTCL